MSRKPLVLFVVLILGPFPGAQCAKKKPKGTETEVEFTGKLPASLWQYPTDIATRDLFYGPGGKKHAPDTIYTFLKEDLDGSSPKFYVQDENGVKWKVKMGAEARPEIPATRLVWAAGYYANEDYFLPVLKVERMPRLHRGQKMVEPDGTIHNVRMKRYEKDEKKIASWSWRENRYTGTREENGLRVMMALINNWDLKDVNTGIYKEDNSLIYMVNDVGASFGTAGPAFPRSKAKGNLKFYTRSKFITKVAAETVDFAEPARPPFYFAVDIPQYRLYRRLHWIGTSIPREDARWIGNLLGRLSAKQIRDAFRAAQYTPEQVEGFATVVENRIAALKAL